MDRGWVQVVRGGDLTRRQGKTEGNKQHWLDKEPLKV